ncbi:hypothetical protein TSUD_68670 [Trifolium subterraneum]|uniref:Subtilisin-like protease fibronectin type-III domain-containing protein n=1 Tax=Trifolium subterraneum TaxID=3900 RepID=A0A2Z6NBM4_TRISU|nr:hypothetical protein TSUD_68670 [Trifolium subterraneum]
MLTSLLGSKEAAKNSLLYSYKHGFSGFAARMSKSQAQDIAKFPEVVSVIPNGIHKLHTTRSWDFIGVHHPFSKTVFTESNLGEGTIIGIWPESASFNDEAMGKIPSKWKGVCQIGENFNSTNCNKKIIGARWFLKGINDHTKNLILRNNGTSEYLSARDAIGHGTHTASTAAGYFVENANYKGLASGLARGGAPLAHLAIYKACWDGQSIDNGKHNLGFAGLTYSERIARDPSDDLAKDCQSGSLNETMAAGKIVLCFSVLDQQDIISAALTVKEAGGVGLIYAQHQEDGLNECGILPCIKVDYEAGTQLLTYIRRERFPTARISFPKTVIGKWISPRVASFSSRGPSTMSPTVLKPDIAAPASQSGTDGSLISEEGSTNKEADPFDIGGGHVDPNKAMNAGLIYNITTENYIQFLCSMGHNTASIRKVTKTTTSCNKQKYQALINLNLPSISIPNLKKDTTVMRTVTNVGNINVVYKAIVKSPYGIKVKVEPQMLRFNSDTKVLTFNVSFISIQKLHGDYRFGSLTWTDGKHFLRTPIAVRTIQFES